jgi:2-keto-4-pentenoate hydratase/2-oxohepta-3-ene-1,7-dioic acid hydratase in catechol pathway
LVVRIHDVADPVDRLRSVLAGGLTPGLTLAALEPGDRVEVQVEGIGVLTNQVVAEPAG